MKGQLTLLFLVIILAILILIIFLMTQGASLGEAIGQIADTAGNISFNQTP